MYIYWVCKFLKIRILIRRYFYIYAFHICKFVMPNDPYWKLFNLFQKKNWHVVPQFTRTVGVTVLTTRRAWVQKKWCFLLIARSSAFPFRSVIQFWNFVDCIPPQPRDAWIWCASCKYEMLMTGLFIWNLVMLQKRAGTSQTRGCLTLCSMFDIDCLWCSFVWLFCFGVFVGWLCFCYFVCLFPLIVNFWRCDKSKGYTCSSFYMRHAYLRRFYRESLTVTAVMANAASNWLKQRILHPNDAEFAGLCSSTMRSFPQNDVVFASEWCGFCFNFASEWCRLCIKAVTQPWPENEQHQQQTAQNGATITVKNKQQNKATFDNPTPQHVFFQFFLRF